MTFGLPPVLGNITGSGSNPSALLKDLDVLDQEAADDYPTLLRFSGNGCANLVTLVIRPLERAASIMVTHRGHSLPVDFPTLQQCLSLLQQHGDIDADTARGLTASYQLMLEIVDDHQCQRPVSPACPDGCVSLPELPRRRAEQLSNCILLSRRFRAQLRTQLIGHLA